ncbi:MAG: hypothetical protein WCT04_26810 [Planctomycetota bacterium]
MAVLQIEYWHTGGYNTQRYGKPWIAKVVAWEIGTPPQLKFGRDLKLDVELGDVMRWGQKDNQNSRGTRSWWGLVSLGVGGELAVEQCTERQARKHWREMEAFSDGTRSLSDTQMKCFALTSAIVARKDLEMRRILAQMIESNRVPTDTHRMNDAQLEDFLKGYIAQKTFKNTLVDASDRD